MQLFNKLLTIFILLFVCAQVSAQLTLEQVSTTPKIEAEKELNTVVYPSLESVMHLKEDNFKVNEIKSNLVYQHYGFFCKSEADRDKKTSIPIRMRLGTLEQVNTKEAKPGY